MRVAIYPIVAYEAIDRRKGTAQRRYRVSYRFYPFNGHPGLQRKRGGFCRKGEAEAFAHRLREAAAGQGSCRFTKDGHLVMSRTGENGASMSIFDAVQTYWQLRRPNLSPAQRAKVRLVLSEVVRLTATTAEVPSGADEYLRTVAFGAADRDRH